jgi:hypothetical protein
VQREVWEIVEKCRVCGAVVVALVCEDDLDEEGAQRRVVYRDRVPHSRIDCERLVTLQREEWPVLF